MQIYAPISKLFQFHQEMEDVVSMKRVSKKKFKKEIKKNIKRVAKRLKVKKILKIFKKSTSTRLIKKVYCRTFQTALRGLLPILPYRNPEVYEHMEQIPGILRKNLLVNPLIITDITLARIGAVEPLKKILDEAGISYAIFDQTVPNPTTALVEAAAKVYREHHCDSLIAFGGGSPMDLAKGVGVRIARPRTPLTMMKGILKVLHKLPTIIAVPTTAGTGSETTLASVLVDSKTRHKFTINDFPLIPRYAILDAKNIHSLPASIGAATAMDALTHAVEAYIGRSTTKETRSDAELAVKLIFRYMDASIKHEDATSERGMLYAAHYAGRAFTRSYVGYNHAISHSLSGQYDLPHGWTNAVLLPLVLRKYGHCIDKKLARLAVYAGLDDRHAKVSSDRESSRFTDAELAERFIQAIENMNRKYGIPDHIDVIQKEDIPTMAAYAEKEANPLYPVPVLWGRKELTEIYYEVGGLKYDSHFD